jgi:transcriptional regulator of acetoin/glycerol metabolism
VPPLRYHLEDVQALVPFFLTRLVPDGRLTCSREAMQMLSQSSWPGNIEQLWQVLRNIVQHRRSGAIQPGGLPPECRTVSRRLLSPLEAMERDAIVRSLLDWDGSKIKAAAALGMSRATSYREIHEYGIVAPTK